jgi:nucleoside-diphosphate-sugar epimerase
MYKALVTGSSSFIGKHLINKLIEKGADISAFVRDRGKIPDEWKKNIKIFEGDITDKKSLSEIPKDIDVVFHLAAYVHKNPKSKDEKDYMFKVNVEGTRNLLDSICTSVRHVVLFSSVSVYGVDAGQMLDETCQTSPVTPYARSKFEAENILKNWGQERHIKTTSLRLPLVYGPGNKGNIYKLIEAVDKNRFIMLGKGQNKRSMVYVGNVVDAALSIVDKDEADGKVYIVTDGIDYTVRELYETIAKELGKKPRQFYIPISIAKALALAGDIVGRPFPLNSSTLNKLAGSLTFSSLNIQKGIGFKPKYNLYNTIGETIRWYKQLSNGQQQGA